MNSKFKTKFSFLLLKTSKTHWQIDNNDAPIRPNEITPQPVYHTRRDWIKENSAFLGGIGLLGSSSLLLNTQAFAQSAVRYETGNKYAKLPFVPSTLAGATTLEKLTSYKDATSYNNYYEFGLDKDEPVQNAHALKTTPWHIQVEGLVKKSKTFGLEELLKMSAMQERIYRMRCVEGWSMVVPWIGYSLSELLKKVEPLASAKFVEFVTIADPKAMPNIQSKVLDWPYTEGLRLDEAMHPLTLLTFGMYGEILPNQNGAPVRLVVPWKYGFKSAKSIVKIRLLDRMPQTAWNKSAAHEYGFYSNVNPNVDHPRWSQASERRLGEGSGLFAKKHKTLLFNGYEAQVGQLYAGMDLKKNF